MDEALADIDNIAKAPVTALNAHFIQEASLDWRVARRTSSAFSGFIIKHSSQSSSVKVPSLILRFKVIGLSDLLRTSIISVLKFIIWQYTATCDLIKKKIKFLLFSS